ncbi:polysaccharide deacetylase family protein [Paenibacillus faecis]|uniref:polysaccharide deacetylase family protein n=1 Tax=Paenibacillus faecis TaxID=862114 RepID=UPI0027962E52|nr:polysaccharide deacetylase family protein [Paenibacillus faecis]
MKPRYHLCRLIVTTVMIFLLVISAGTGYSAAAGSKPDSSSGNKANKMVALTFDDGPDKTYTGKVLDILRDKKVKGTFFVVGNRVKQYPDVMKRIVKEGHALGNHSWSHTELTKLGKEKVRQEIVKTDKAIRETTGSAPTMMRPPYGATSGRVKGEIQALGHAEALWTVDTRDWAAGSSVASILKTVKSSSGNKITVLMHSGGGKRDKTVKALPQIIDYYRSQGYTFVTMAELNGLADNLDGSTPAAAPDTAKQTAPSKDVPSKAANSPAAQNKDKETAANADGSNNRNSGTEERNIHLIYDGTEVEFSDAKPHVDENSRILVPVRFMAESLGFGVKWEGSGDQKHLILWKDNTHVDLKIGDKVAVVNEAQIQMDTSVIIIKEKTYVPLRFVSELAGMDMTWNSADSTVTLSSKKPAEEIIDEKPADENNEKPENDNGDERTVGDTYILSAPRATVQQAKAWASAKGATEVFINLADIVWEEALKAGVDPTVVYCQAAKETGFGKFGGILDETFNNPAGLKNQTGGSDTDHTAHQRFFSWEEGVQAQVDHLALYAGAPGYPKLDTPDPRHFPALQGKAVTVEALGGSWASVPTYGVEIVKMMLELAQTNG